MNNKTINNTASILSIFALMILIAAPAMAATLSREMPSRVDPGSQFTAKLNIPDAVAGETLTIEETLPEGVTLASWDISGAKETKTALQSDPKKYRVKDRAYAWSVTPVGPVTITYTASAPASEGNVEFNAVYFDKNGFNKNPYTLNVATATAPAPVAPEPTPAVAPAPTPPTTAPATKTTNAAETPSTTGTWVLIAGLILLIAAATWYYYSKAKR